MKNTGKTLRIVHGGVKQLSNGESAVAGSASELTNMREREQSLEVVGMPRAVGQLQQGDRVLLVDDDRMLVLRGNDVMWGQQVVVAAACRVLSAHRVGQLVVIVTEQGNVVLRRTAGGYVSLDINDAVPQLHIAAVEQVTHAVAIPSYEFAQPYNTWQSPLAAADIDGLTRLMRNGLNTVLSETAAQGRFTGVMAVRYGVRLWDDSYVWLSQPLLVGNAMLRASYRASTDAYTTSGKYAGVDAFSLSVDSYRLGISVVGGVPSQWHDLVKSVDVLALPQAQVFDLTSSADYRCAVTTSSGTRRYVLELGPKPRAATAILQQALKGNWQVIASTATLDGNGFVAVNTAVSSQQVISGVRCDAITSKLQMSQRVTQEQCAALMAAMSQRVAGSVAMEHNGRLYQAPTAMALSNPWQVLPWLSGTVTNTACNAVVKVTLSTGDGETAITTAGTCPCSASALNPMIAFPDVRATHIAIAVGSRKWECDLAPLKDTGMAVYINPSIGNNAMTGGAVSPSGSSVAILPSQGTLTVSAVGNALVTQWRTMVSGCEIRGLAAACRPIYSGGFGRYPIYLFTNEGIMALPQSLGGTFGEPRLISEAVLAAEAVPVGGNDGVWFVSQYGELCFLSGSTAKLMLKDVAANAQLAWNAKERELWISATGSWVKVLMPSGNTYSRDLVVGNLYSDAQNALAVTDAGTLVDLTNEDSAVMAVSYMSHPLEIDAMMCKSPKRITWNVFTTRTTPSTAVVTLTLRGERGSSCHGYVISRVRANGVIAAPLSRPLIAHPSRTLRLAIAGSLPSGTIALATVVSW